MSAISVAQQLGRTTAKLAYDLLLSEGYLEGVVGAETRVCDLVPEESSKIKHKLAPPAAKVRP